MAVIMAAAIAPSAIAAPREPTHETLTARNRAVIAEFADLFYRQRKVRAAFMTHVAPNYIQHNPSIADGRDAAIAALEPLFSTPGASFDIQRILVDGDMAAIHLRGRPDPSRPAVVVADIYRLEDGRIVEHWDVLQPIEASAVNPHPYF